MFAPATALQLTREERAEIDHLVANGNTPQKLARRARIIALAADGLPNRQIAALVDVSRPTVIAQRRRFEEAGLRGLVKDRTRRSGRWPALAAAVVKKIVDATRKHGASQCHSMDDSLDGRVGWRVAPPFIASGYSMGCSRIESKPSRPPMIPSWLRRCAISSGCYLDPPDKVLVFSVDEKISIQTLDRTQPGLPMKKGRCATITHDYKRHGTFWRRSIGRVAP